MVSVSLLFCSCCESFGAFELTVNLSLVCSSLVVVVQVLIGEGSKEAGDRLEAAYRKMCENTPKICRMSAESAEICKLGVNCFVTMKGQLLFLLSP